MHLMCGDVAPDEAPAHGAHEDAVPPSEFEALKAEQKALTAELAQLRAFVEYMANELGIDVGKLTRGV